jgi:hypothetical protein
MELTEFFFGIIITIVGVIVVETFIQIYSKKQNQNRLIRSLYHEVASNIALIVANKGLQPESGIYRYFSFRNIAYHQFMLGFMIDEKTSKVLINNLFKAYALMDSHNRTLERGMQKGGKMGNVVYNDLEKYLEKVRIELESKISNHKL